MSQQELSPLRAEIQGRGNIVIPNTDIFSDSTIGSDCLAVFSWFKEFIDRNSSTGSTVPHLLYVPGNESKAWLVVTTATAGQEHTQDHGNGNRETVGEKNVVTVQMLQAEAHTSQTLLTASNTPRSRSGDAMWTTRGNSSAECGILTPDGWLNVYDADLMRYDHYRGDAPHISLKYKEYIDRQKVESDTLRQTFSDFIEYIQ